MKIIKLYFLLIILASNAYAQTSISNISGTTLSKYSNQGKWVGQPDIAPKNKNKYINYYVADYVYNTEWIVEGKGFGNNTGTIIINDNRIKFRIVSWTDSRIKLKINTTTPEFTYKENVKITAKNTNNIAASFSLNVVGSINLRTYGQCTWYVAYRRLGAKLSPPDSPYSTIGKIDIKYIPQQWDCLVFDGHVAIITSAVRKIEDKNKKTTTYSFTIGEMNVNWCECESSKNVTFVVDEQNKKVTNLIESGILKNATGYWRK
jgi:hypothetical protein